MSLIPDSKLAKVQFFQSKITPWTTNATAIGTTSAAVTDLQTKATAAQDSLNAQEAAKAAAQLATETADNAVAVMVAAGADIIKQIRTKAALSTDPTSIYALAQIPSPALPTPCGPLGMPSNFGVELQGDGALKLKWKCTNPRAATGVVYQIFRRIGMDGQFEYLAGAGGKEFMDNTVPAGASQVTYQLQAVRSTSVGPWAQYNVNFGTGSGGAMTASVTEGTPAKIAA